MLRHNNVEAERSILDIDIVRRIVGLDAGKMPRDLENLRNLEVSALLASTTRLNPAPERKGSE